MSRQLLDALHETARKEDASFLVIGHWDGELSGIDRVTIRIWYAETEWRPAAFLKTPISMKKAYVVDATRRLTLTTREAWAGLGRSWPNDRRKVPSTLAA